MGDHIQAVTHIPHWLPAYAGLPRDENHWGMIHSESGFRGVLKRLLEVMNSGKGGYPLHYAKATIYAQLSDLDQAVDARAHNVDVRSPNFAGMRMDALLDPLRSFPRFVELLKSLGI